MRTRNRSILLTLGMSTLVMVPIGDRADAVATSAPANDDFDAATTLTLPFVEVADTSAATTAVDDPDCHGNTHTVWYRFTPGADMRVLIGTFGSGFPPSVSVYTGSRGALTQTFCDFGGHIELDLVSGTSYSFMVGDAGSGVGTPRVLKFKVDRISQAANDDFDANVSVSTLPYFDAVDGSTATVANDDPARSCGAVAQTFWYRFTPSVNIRLVISTDDSSYDTTLSVYTGSRGALSEVACSEDHLPYYGMAYAQVDVTAGTTYYVMVGGWVSIDNIPGPGCVCGVSFEQGHMKSTMSIDSSKSTIRFRRSVTITAHLDEYQDTTNPVIAIYATPYGGHTKRLTSDPVDAIGDVAITVALTKRTSFETRWTGDDRWAASRSKKVDVQVRVIVKGKLSRNYGSSGKYKLYHSDGVVLYTGRIVPDHTGQFLCFTLQRRSPGDWRNVDRACFKIREHSAVTVVIGAGVLRRSIPYRIDARAELQKHHDHAESTSPWSYFKVTA